MFLVDGSHCEHRPSDEHLQLQFEIEIDIVLGLIALI